MAFVVWRRLGNRVKTVGLDGIPTAASLTSRLRRRMFTVVGLRPGMGFMSGSDDASQLQVRGMPFHPAALLWQVSPFPKHCSAPIPAAVACLLW